jgi:hypothetical protein
MLFSELSCSVEFGALFGSVCLIRILRQHGSRSLCTCNVPLWGLADSNAMLRPLGCGLSLALHNFMDPRRTCHHAQERAFARLESESNLIRTKLWGSAHLFPFSIESILFESNENIVGVAVGIEQNASSDAF